MQRPREVAGRPSLNWLLALPAVAGGGPLRAPERGFGGGAGNHRPRILLVEDDSAIAEMFRMQLSIDGYSVRTAGDGHAALEQMEVALPELVLLDVLLPGPDGFWVLEQIRARWAVPVVMLSNYGDRENVSRGLRLGARDYVIKSRMTPVDISRAIPRWIDPPRS